MQGKLRATDPISKYLPNVPSDKQGVTIAQLMSHSSGIRGGGEDYEPVERDELVRRALEIPLAFPPGTSSEYSNAGFSLLGAIIERVSGLSWEDYLDRYLWKPAGMTQTGYRASKWDRGMVAHSYPMGEPFGSVLDYPGPYRPGPDGHYPGPYWNLATNGGALSTLGDLLKWDAALNSDVVLSDEARKTFSERHAPDPEWGNGTYYSYGWDVTSTPRGTRIVHKTGSSEGTGISAWLLRYIDDHVTVIIASNRSVDGMVMNRLMGSRLDSLIFGTDPPLPPTAASETWTPQDFAGVYRVPSGETLLVTGEKQSLLIKGRGRAAVRLLAFGGQPPPSELLQHSVTELITALDRDDTQALRAQLWSETWFDSELPHLAEWWHQVKRDMGALLGTETIGTAPGTFVQHVFVNARFSRGSELLVLQQNQDGRFFVPGDRIDSVMPVPGALRFVPQGRDDFASFSLVTGPGVRVRFERDAHGRPIRLILARHSADIVALREPGS
jgi:CubicO group peptidase (beta-lactamase class C family)